MSNCQNELGQQKYFANRGVARNKSRLPNLRIKVEIRKELSDMSDEDLIERYRDYKFKDEGYINVLWTKSLDYKGQEPVWNLGTSVNVLKLKEILGTKRWSKFCQGKREFIIQRRVDGRNVKIKKD